MRTYITSGAAPITPRQRSYFDRDPHASRAERVAKLKQLQPLCRTTKGVNFARLDRQSLDVVEQRALQEARDGSARSGRLFWTEQRDESGRKVLIAEGDPRAWMKPYMAEPLHVQFNKHAGQHQEYGRWVPDGSHMETVANRGPNAEGKP